MMAERPWTAVAEDPKSQGHVTFSFNASYDAKDAASDFKEKYSSNKGYKLVALIPGEHQHVYIEGKQKIRRIPKDQLFSGF